MQLDVSLIIKKANKKVNKSVLIYVIETTYVIKIIIKSPPLRGSALTAAESREWCLVILRGYSSSSDVFLCFLSSGFEFGSIFYFCVSCAITILYCWIAKTSYFCREGEVFMCEYTKAGYRRWMMMLQYAVCLFSFSLCLKLWSLSLVWVTSSSCAYEETNQIL